MVRFRRQSLPLLAALAAAALAGCSGGSGGRKEVTGQVKLAGQPVKDGVISFEPLDGQESKSGAPIKDGAYTVPKQSGLQPGKYRIQITAGDGVTPADSTEPPGPTNIVSRDTIPPEWNVRSNKDVTVTEDGPNEFNFDIPARKK